MLGGLFKFVLLVLVVLVALAFAGVQPLADYKDKAIEGATTLWSDWQERQED